MNIRKIK
jgi:hypothetical protein